MRKVQWYCDRCGKLIEGTVHVLAVHFYDHEVFSDMLDEEEGAHLCESCFKIVDEATLAAVHNVTPAGQEEKPKRKNGGGQNKKVLDLGKIAALRNAGWSLEKIGQETHCSAHTVANHMDEAMEFLSITKGENYDD